VKTCKLYADDVGARAAVNAAVARMLADGRLSGVSVLANTEGTEEAAELLRRHPEVEVSLHFNVTYGRPLCPPDTLGRLVDGDGAFYPRDRLMARLLSARIDPEAVQRELQAQLARLDDLGLEVKRIDAHDHIHGLSPIAELVTDASTGRGLPAPRSLAHLQTRTIGGRMKKAAFRTVGGVSRLTTARRPGLPSTWHRNGGAPFAVATWERFDGRLLPDGQVVVCHPGADCDLLTGLDIP
jgi:predicted glycoside hydrolase/deacetylase ChbG (UPF0249 family)